MYWILDTIAFLPYTAKSPLFLYLIHVYNFQDEENQILVSNVEFYQVIDYGINLVISVDT